MNRPIKFRAWSKRGKSMTYDIVGVAPAKASYGDSISGDGLFVNPGKSTHYEVMQFTGLLDKSGKDIYEGDLFRCIYFSDGHDNHVYEIVYQPEYARFFLKRHGERCPQSGVVQHPHDVARYEIIGNKWENPELLETNSPTRK